MNPEFTLSVDDIKTTQQNALELFYSGIKSPQTKHTMEGNLKYFLLKVCKDILEGDLEKRAQQFDLFQKNMPYRYDRVIAVRQVNCYKNDQFVITTC